MQKNENTFVLAGVLFAITALVALLLSLVNNVTAPKISEIEKQEQTLARSAVLRGADDFKEIALTEDISELVQSIHEGAHEGQTVGYCVSVSPAGFGGPINMIVGLNLEGAIEGVKIVSFSETPGLGSKAQDAVFCDQFRNKGKSGLLKVIKSGTAKSDEIVAVSGATVSSKAVTTGVNAAIEAVNGIREGDAE
ncbi:MAG: RnfABCDGE type electron transport complex subunit G [Clostridia bacterium]|nr:RnfABCDGE type electron transport complex subunit G [Clostridia bacterium]